MAVISKIRKKAGLVITTVGLAMAAFILGDFLNSNKLFFSDDNTTIGEVNGEKINLKIFNDRYLVLESNYKNQSGKAQIDEQTKDYLLNEVWNNLLDEKLYQPIYASMGLTVSNAELLDLIQGNNIHPQIQQIPAFADSTGTFQKSKVVEFIQGLSEANEPEDPAAKANWLEMRKQWKNFEDYIIKEKVKEKYLTLLKKGIYTTKKTAELEHVNKNKKIVFEYITKSYDEIPDSLVEVSDKEIKNYYEEHKNEYKQKQASRQIEYVLFEVVPTPEDILLMHQEMEKIANNFKTTENDTTFVNQHSDVAFQQKYVSKKELPFGMDSLFAKANLKDVIGPYQEGETYKIAKLMGRKLTMDSVKAKHILIKAETEADKSKAKAKIDSIKNVIKKGGNFEELAKKFSEDPGSAAKGGDLGWFTEGQMVPEFNDACFNGKVGDMPVVTTMFGVHLIKIEEQTKPKEKLSLILVEKKIQPSSKTLKKVYAEATDFAAQNNTYEIFVKAAETKKMNKQTADLLEGSKKVNNIENSRSIVNWAFQAKQGEVSKAIELDNQYIVATLKSVKDKGILPLEQVKSEILPMVRREKKAQQLIAQFNDNKSTSFEDLAKKMKLEPKTAEGVTFSSFFIPSLGVEPEIIGTVFGSKKDVMSKPIKGNTGVFVIKLQSITDAPPITNLNELKSEITFRYAQRASYQAFSAINDIKNVVDNRARFY